MIIQGAVIFSVVVLLGLMPWGTVHITGHLAETIKGVSDANQR